MPASPLTIQAWFQAPAQYSSSPRRAQGGAGWGGASEEYKEQDSGLTGQSVWLGRDMVLSVEREDVISLLE